MSRGESTQARPGQGRGSLRLHLVLVALLARGCGGDKPDTGAMAPEAPAATATEAGAPQAVSSIGGEGVATAPTETQAATSIAAATAVAAGDSGGDWR